jgi:hypothetical protein
MLSSASATSVLSSPVTEEDFDATGEVDPAVGTREGEEQEGWGAGAWYNDDEEIEVEEDEHGEVFKW